MTKFLASVKNKTEADMVYAAGVDIIDLKDPAKGALGALPIAKIKTIASKMKTRSIISTTIGDLPSDPGIVLPAVEAKIKTGVDIVKIGFFPGNQHSLANALAMLARKQKLVAVLFADQNPDFRLLKTLSNSHFYGIMLDTARKDNRGLLAHLSTSKLKAFIKSGHQLSLECGLAGQLKLEDIPILLPLKPDYLGFRSALCKAKRDGQLSIDAILQARDLIAQGHQGKSSSIQQIA